MPLQSPPRKISETEYMLRLLLCVDVLESVNETQLWAFVAELDLMDYVTMRLCLHKLLSAGELETGEGALREQLFLTDRGREALLLFGGRLPSGVRERVEQAAPAFRGKTITRRQVRAVYEMARLNDFRLHLTVCDGDLPTIRLRMATANRTLAGHTIHRFSAHASETTTYLYEQAEHAMLAPPDGLTHPLAPGAVTEHSQTEFTANVTIHGKKADFGIELLLPSRKAAEIFVLTFSRPESAMTLANRLTELVSAPVPRVRTKK